MKYLSKNLGETAGIAKDFLESISLGGKATVVALQGDLGAGKTAFTQEAGKIMGGVEEKHNPTFLLIKKY